jgi:predicted phage terminase large subunit-like protein
MGADILIIDDPFKDRAEADSGTIRQKVWDWYTSTAYTRLSDGGGVIVMCTRWHTDDLIGRLIRHMNDGSGDKFTVINYPAIAEHDEPHRKAGEALHPERFSLERLQSIRQTIGSRDWSALYQQKPVPEGGAVFKLDLFNKWNDKTLPPSFDNVLGSWDMTFKDTKASDYVVGQIWAQKDNSFYLLDEVRGQWDFSKTLEMFILMADKWRNVNRWLIEDKANGSAILSVLKKHINGLTPITPKESKLERAYAVQPLVESGQVYIPSSASWLAGFEDEFLSFPAGAHDDQVDSFTQALNYCREHTHRKIHQANLLALQQPRFR